MGLPMKDVVVLLPGITGSRLTRDHNDVWAMSPGAVGRAVATLGGSVRNLALKQDDPYAERLDDGIEAPSLLPDMSILPGLKWRIDGYGVVDTQLRDRFNLARGKNFFHFPYDWRRDNRAHAWRLARESRQWLSAWRQSSGNESAKLVLIAHSMGGLVARYYLECLNGWRDTRTLITFGTPYSGSLNALGFLVNGYKKKLGPFTLVDLSETMRTFTSVYQLLPIFQSIDLGDGVLRRLADLNSLRAQERAPDVADLDENTTKRALALLGHLDENRLTAALDFHYEIEAAVDEHRKNNYEGTGGYDIRPVIGEFQPTKQSAIQRGNVLELLEQRSGADEGGDGTVPRLSSVPKELFTTMENVSFAAHRHSALQNSDPVLTQVHGLLRGIPEDPGKFFAGITRVALDVDDIFVRGEPIEVRTRCDTPATRLNAMVLDVVTGDTVARVTLEEVGTEWTKFELPPLPAGDYRLAVTGGASVDCVTEIFTVIDARAVTPSA